MAFHIAGGRASLVGVRCTNLPTTVQDLVASLRYANKGTVKSTDTYRLLTVGSIYNEGYNYLDEVSDDRWTELGHLRYLFQVTLNGSTHEPLEFINNTDFPGDDYKHVPLSANLSSWGDCRDLCGQLAVHCTAWTFDHVNPSTSGCWLKSTVASMAPKSGVISGCMNNSMSSVCIGSSVTNASAPPSGMRSAVPLGSLGGGTIELRADGRLADWEIFNNGPQARGGGKVNINEAVLGILSQPLPSDGQRQSTAAPFASLLRTHMDSTNKELPVIESLTYSGAFPAARLVAEDSTLKQGITVTAFSPFMRQNPNKSVTPAIAFHVNISNPMPHDADTAVFFNIPNMLTNVSSLKTAFAGYNSDANVGVTLSADGGSGSEARYNGNLTISVMKKTDDIAVDSITAQTSESLKDSWGAFVTGNGVFKTPSINPGAPHAAIAAKLHVPANTSTQVTLLLSWFFPQRLFADEEVGQYYANFFTSSQNVADFLAADIIPVLTAIQDWNKEAQFTESQKRFKTAFPSDFLDDALVNSPGAMTKTSMFLRDGRWRQWESHSCAQMEPPHIHGYRAFAYHVIFPTLERQTLMLYADQMTADGLVSELFGGGCFGASKSYNLDTAMGGARGDDNAVFILDVYMNWMSYHDNITEGQKFLDSIWPKFQLAVQWQLAHASKYGLTEDLVNTFDEHGLIGDVNSYNAFLYISSLTAAALLGDKPSKPNATFVKEVLAAREVGLESLDKLLWTGKFYRSFWCANGETSPNALQSDSLYGVVWDNLLQLKAPLPVQNLVSHLQEERKRNLTPYGMQFCTGRTTPGYHCTAKNAQEEETDNGYGVTGKHSPFVGMFGSSKLLGSSFTDNDTWEAHTINSGSLSLFLKASSEEEALSLAGLNIDKYRLIMRDQWDYRDLSSCYSGDVPGAADCVIRPVCNSHYSRQLIFHVIPIALSGQRLDALTGTLYLSPRQIVSEQWPIALGGKGSALMRPVGHTITYKSMSAEGNMNDDPLLEGVALAGECYEIEVYSGGIAVRHLKLFGTTLGMDINIARHHIATYCF